MKVLLITNLYPNGNNFDLDDNTKAIHNIMRLWDCEKEVIRTSFFPEKNSNFKLNEKNIYFVENIKVHHLTILKIPKLNYFFSDRLIKYQKKNDINFDVVMAHRLPSAISAGRLAKLHNKPLIVGVHFSDITNTNLLIKSTKVFEQASYIACRSHTILNYMKETFPQFEEKCFLALSGIEEDIILPLDTMLKKQSLWINQSKPIKFISVAKLIERKNIDYNLRALAMLKGIDWEYTILGDGPQMDDLKRLTIDLGIDERVNFYGKVSRNQVLRYLEESDIFVMVSSNETFGLSYIEAMAKGCIIVGSLNSGIDGLINDRNNGFLCNPKDVESLYLKIKVILKSNKSFLDNVIINSYNTINKLTEEHASQVYYKKVQDSISKEL